MNSNLKQTSFRIRQISDMRTIGRIWQNVNLDSNSNYAVIGQCLYQKPVSIVQKVSTNNLVIHGASVDGTKCSFTEEPTADDAVLTDDLLITNIIKHL